MRVISVRDISKRYFTHTVFKKLIDSLSLKNISILYTLKCQDVYVKKSLKYVEKNFSLIKD